MRLLSLFSLLCLSLNAQAFEGDPVLGQQKAPSCVFCHGADGKAVNDSYPNLKGQHEAYLFSSMKAYQQGDRKGPLALMMQAQLQRLNDNDLRDIAAFYASQNEN
ncbi:cytochrome c [Vibrio sp. Vb2880]|uniref:Cytochrome C554 n=1 Tax=Vibrio furnissii TaxID=29494 RepID=A0A0Q2R7H0_VIBFU|nr:MULTISPECIES: cytochrome c [Vibrio]ADT89577.1 cytochrome c554 [Vibrio furnissii NCTC 11218]EEX40673.1 cytochrome c553 [Vibrio furnissii CIP 102972]KQH88069.1 cytochrome C554 [Vibrio furnissii]MBO0213699.1 cytochrome c [Vibrio sp. Vb2880]MCG6214057.1 cytochrome c [Vibrio furnissii]